MSEWLAGMRRLDEDIPLKQPKFRTREMRKGFDITECQPQEKVTAIGHGGRGGHSGATGGNMSDSQMIDWLEAQVNEHGAILFHDGEFQPASSAWAGIASWICKKNAAGSYFSICATPSGVSRQQEVSATGRAATRRGERGSNMRFDYLSPRLALLSMGLRTRRPFLLLNSRSVSIRTIPGENGKSAIYRCALTDEQRKMVADGADVLVRSTFWWPAGS